MNSLGLKEKSVSDPDTARLLEALTLVESEEPSMKQFKTEFLKSCREAKSHVRQTIGYFIELLKDREEELCQQIDEHSLQVMFWKEKSPRDSFLLGDPSNDVCTQPTMTVEFVNNNPDLEVKLVEFGSIQVETAKKPVYLDTRKHEEPISCFPFPMNIDTPETFPESSGSAESFEVISDLDLAESPSKPVPKRPSVRDLMFQAVNLSLAEIYKNRPIESLEPKNPPATLLFNQMKNWSESELISATRNERPSPPSALREEFGEYLRQGAPGKWLASSQRK